MSTRDSPGGKGGRCVRLTTYHPCSAERQEIRALTYPDPLRPSRRPVVGETFTFTYWMSHTATMSNKIRQNKSERSCTEAVAASFQYYCDYLLFLSLSTGWQVHGNSRSDYPVSGIIFDIGLFRKRSMCTNLDPSFRSQLLINLVKLRRMKCKRQHIRHKSTTHTNFSSGNPEACKDLGDMIHNFV